MRYVSWISLGWSHKVIIILLLVTISTLKVFFNQFLFSTIIEKGEITQTPTALVAIS